jgi:hypothetical protein
MRKVYLVLAILGFALPYAFFIPFLLENDLNLRLLLDQPFANRISSFFSVDLIISTVVFWVFIYREAIIHQMGNWWVFLVASLTVGLSFALPPYLFFREPHWIGRCPGQTARGHFDAIASGNSCRHRRSRNSLFRDGF